MTRSNKPLLAKEVRAAWAELGFSSKAAHAWIRIGIKDPEVAHELVEGEGLGPQSARHAALRVARLECILGESLLTRRQQTLARAKQLLRDINAGDVPASVLQTRDEGPPVDEDELHGISVRRPHERGD